MPRPNECIEYQFWTNINNLCGPTCDDQMDFVRDFKGHDQILEQGGYALFTPHYIMKYYVEGFSLTRPCKSNASIMEGIMLHT